MNIFAAPFQRSKVIRHPDCRSGRPAHEFAAGLDKPRPTILVIKGLRYEATSFKGDDGTQVVRLVKLAGKNEVYDVSRGSDGLVACDCPSYVKTHEGTSSTCKHGSACIVAGLIEAPAPVANVGQTNRVGHLLPTARPAVAKPDNVGEVPDNVRKVAPVASQPPTWSEANWRRADYFRLRPPVGMKRPVAVEAPAPPALLASIPDEARAVEVLSGLNVGRWIKRDLEHGFVWFRGEGLALADLMSSGEADHLYHQSKLVIVPTPLVPSLDETWHSAYQLARAGVDALLCSTWTNAAKLAFLDGFFWGDLQREVDHEEDENFTAMVDDLSACYSPEMV